MTKYQICVPDMAVTIDDRTKRFPDYTPAPSADINVFRFDTETNSGEIEYLDNGTPHEVLTSIPDNFQAFIDHAEADYVEEQRINALPYYERDGYDNWDRVRSERNSFIRYLDQYITAKDFPFQAGEKEHLIEFRKKLRDIPQDHASSEPKNIRFTPELNIEIDGVITELQERFKENA